MHKTAMALLLLIPVGYSMADAIIFETDFQSLPEGWYAGTQWTFGDDGAVSHRTDPVWEDVLFTRINGDELRIYFIPDGTDSVLVEIPYYISVNNSEVSGGAQFEISATIGSSTDTRIFNIDVWQAGYYVYEGTVEYVFHREGSGWLGFFISSTGGCEPGCGITAHWEIHGITVTVFGDDLDLAPLTWASVKSTFQGPNNTD